MNNKTQIELKTLTKRLNNCERLFYDVNFFQYYPNNIHKNSKPSSYLLLLALQTIDLNIELFLSSINNIINVQGFNKTLWGLRFEKNKLSIEFYFFYKEKFKENSFENLKNIINSYLKTKLSTEKIKKGYYLISFNIGEGEINKLNIYYPVIHKNRPIICIDDTGFCFNTIKPVFHSYYLTPGKSKLEQTNTYYTFFGVYQLFDILNKTREVCLKLFPDENPNLSEEYFKLPYIIKDNKLIHTSAVTIKTGAVGLYFLDISIENFILFLKYHKYPHTYIDAIISNKKNLNHLKYDVGVDFYLKNGKFKIKKTAFWGTI